MAPTPSSSSKSNQNHMTQIKTPQSKHRLQFHTSKTCPSPNPHPTAKDPPTEHPVEVIARIRDHPDRKDQQQPITTLQVNPQKQSIRVRADFGYRDFTLDGVSLSEAEDLGGFYCKFVQSRINRVKLGDKCTIMMYGPTGSGKSHTMFGCSKEPGIVYRSLKDILGDGEEEDDKNGEIGVGTFVQVSILEIYNEEIYDLLSNGGGGGFSLGWPKGNGSNSKVKLEVMGKKAKNASFISGHEAGKISKEIQKVEKRRIVKSTLCNDRSSRSHCMVILDVPTVGGRLMLVDMAGSENIDQAGQTGFEAKMQTAKINQGNIALKRVVESIANGDSHVPFRDSKLTMLLQDSFEDDKSKILMILCASPDPKEIHKTICTLEYGAKAKCIIRGPITPTKDKIGAEDSSSGVILGSRLAAMDEFILKLQRENKLREKEKIEAHKELMKKEEEVSALRARLKHLEERGPGINEEEINLKVRERTQIVKCELERKLEECQRMANERILQQQQEVEMLRLRLEEIEFELHTGDGNNRESISKENDVCGIAKRLLGIYANEDPGMVKSMDLDMDDQSELKFVGGVIHQNDKSGIQAVNQPNLNTLNTVLENGIFAPKFGDKVSLSTVFEEEEVEEEEHNMEDEEEEKEMIEEKRILVDGSTPSNNIGSLACLEGEDDYYKGRSEDRLVDLDSSKRLKRIQNIFSLCGNHRELSQHIRKQSENIDPNSYPEMVTDGDDAILKPFSKEILEVQTFVPAAEDVKDLKGTQCQNLPLSPLPLRPLENILPATPNSCFLQKDGLSPKVSPNLGSTPFITVRKH